MATKNLISAVLPPADKTTIQTAVQTINTKLPFLLSLTNEERKGGMKLGDKSGAFMQKAVDYARTNPTLVPLYLDLTETSKDFALFTDLTNVLEWLKPLVQKIEDTQMEAGVEAFSQILLFYNNVRMAAEKDIPGARTIYEDMQTRFPGRKKKITPKPPIK